ncbi:hypothetical protein Bca52824_076916 [Brassica carinata]|uniref:Uncharacterized protein n=1 Tax=Brassica carinata TaxID=52824 RepID=A0A8X7PVS3_BRACI|nr:hypothetical protein Bca52824_076916 [Brassica carinata]
MYEIFVATAVTRATAFNLFPASCITPETGWYSFTLSFHTWVLTGCTENTNSASCLSSTDYDDDHDDDDSYFHWFTLNETSTTEYQLVPNPKLPSPPQYGSSTAAVESKIFFIGGSTEPSTDLWILDTRSGTMTQGPSMSVNSMQLWE